MSHLFLAMLAAICALFFGGAAFAHHRPSGLFGYTHDRIAFVGHAFGLVFALVAFATVIGISSIVLAVFFGLAAFTLLTGILAAKSGLLPQHTGNLLAYYGDCIGVAGVLCAVMFHLCTGPLYLAVLASLAFVAISFTLVKTGLRSSLAVCATSA